jgi:neuroligin
LSLDLLQRAVLLSGSALSPWAIQLDAERAAASVARQVGCGDGGPVRRDVTPCLQKASLAALLNAVLPSPAFLPRIGPPPPDVLLAGIDPERAMKEKSGMAVDILLCL